MGLFDEYFEGYDYDEEERPASCKTCGATGLYWSEVGTKPDGKPRWQLFDSRTDERHACVVIRSHSDRRR